MPSDYDIREGKLMYIAGLEAGKEVPFKTNQIILDDVVSIDRVQNVYLLRSLTGEGVVVSGRKVREKILEVNDRLALLNSEIEYRPVQALSSTKSGAKNQKAVRFILFLMVVAAAGLVVWNQYKARSVVGEVVRGATKDPRLQAVAAAPAKTPASSVLNLSDRIKLARVEFEIAERLYKDRSVDQGNLYAAIQGWERVEELFHGDFQEHPLAVSARERLGNAKAELKTELEYLYKNAFVANTIGDHQALSAILGQIMRACPDPSDKQYYQWAQKKLFDSPGHPLAKK